MGIVAKVLSVAPIGFKGSLVEVESDIKNGLPSLQIVGLGNKAIDEARERVRSAITNSLLEFPTKKIVINLAPAELPKDGTHYDLAIALSILVSSGQLRHQEVENMVFAGELALDGSLRAVKASISITETAANSGIKTVFLPKENISQASLIDGVTIYGVSNLKELFLHLKGEARISETPILQSGESLSCMSPILDDVLGQVQAKRALIIAAAGRHNILFTGSPGAGKTMLAKTLLSLLPMPSKAERIAITKLHSLAGETIDTVMDQRPFRAPHHTASRVAIIGGGSKPVPGEISLAHKGVLFLDEIPEYARSTLEALRQPLEDRKVAISRANGHVEFPADFMMISTMNPCPCGYYGDMTRECTCTSTQIQSYQKRLSGPLMDRIDMVINVPRVATKELLTKNLSSKKQHIDAQKVIKIAQNAQANRYDSSDIYNASLTSRDVKHHLVLDDDSKQLADKASDKFQLSARSYFKVIKVAQTIADLEGSRTIKQNHVAEALQYRQSTS